MLTSGLFQKHCPQGKWLSEREKERKMRQRPGSPEQRGWVWYCPRNGYSQTRVVLRGGQSRLSTAREPNMGTVPWELQSGVERTLEATNLSLQIPKGWHMEEQARRSHREVEVSLFRGRHSLSIMAPHPQGWSTVLALS